MPLLIEIRDPLSGERLDHHLPPGDSLALALMSIYPDGITGPWRVYKGTVRASNEIAAASMAHVFPTVGEVYILARGVGADPTTFLVNLAISAMLSIGARMLAPRRRTRQQPQEDRESGNNQLAGQTNLLRPGGRIPEIMGRVRSYPDLITPAIEQWDRRTQSIQQFFVIGMGDYELTAPRLGETSLLAISGSNLLQYLPGISVPAMRASKIAPEVNGISLMTEQAGQVPAQVVTFNAAAQTMTVPAALPGVDTGDMLRILFTAANNGFRYVIARSGTGPYVYTLDAGVVDEVGVSASFELFEFQFNWLQTKGLANASPYFTTFSSFWWEYNALLTKGASASAANAQAATAEPGWVVSINPTPSGVVERGYIRSYVNTLRSSGGYHLYQLAVEDANGLLYSWGSNAANAGDNRVVDASFWKPAGAALAGAPPGPSYPAPTDWYRAPLDELDELWADIAFPGGLVWYDNGERKQNTVQVRVDFRRPGATAAQATITETFSDNTSGALRWTRRYTKEQLAALGLPAGTGYEVSLQRITPVQVDTSTSQFLDETVWAALTAIKLIPSRPYPDCTIAQLALTNTRAAVGLGETAFNVIATRKLPSWSAGGGWGAPAPSVKWADNFAQRCRASDGANRPDEQIDLAGIYALQAELDALDGGAQGVIGITLDQVQDIDAELLQIADVVRAVVYRSGRKLFASRDDANAVTLALFNGRTKSPDGETVAVRMTSDGEQDGVTVAWSEVGLGYKVREFTYPPLSLATNVLRLPVTLTNWPQAWRRAVYEWNRLKYRREQLSLQVTEDGRICRPGDVVAITDDIATLAASAGEVVYLSGLTLVLDRDVLFGAGAHSILLRDVQGIGLDVVPCSAVAGSPNRVLLSRAPTVEVKGRDNTRGTLFAFYNDAAATVRPWLITGVEASGPYVQLAAVNYSPKVYDGDSAALPAPPALFELPIEAEAEVEP